MTRQGDWIQTATGKQFWPLDPRPNEIDIEDIAHALSMQCRYGGHCRRFYSVAEHCVHVSRLAQPHQLWGLLHDAAEAYLVDLPRPIKASMPEYFRAEDSILRAVCIAFNLHLDMPSVVKDVDHRILTDERIQIMAPAPRPWATDADPLGVTLQCWAPSRAKKEFLQQFEHLTRRVA